MFLGLFSTISDKTTVEDKAEQQGANNGCNPRVIPSKLKLLNIGTLYINKTFISRKYCRMRNEQYFFMKFASIKTQNRMKIRNLILGVGFGSF